MVLNVQTVRFMKILLGIKSMTEEKRKLRKSLGSLFYKHQQKNREGLAFKNVLSLVVSNWLTNTGHVL